MKKTSSTSAAAASLQIKSGVKAGGVAFQHNESQLRIKSGVKAGGVAFQHNESQLRVR